VSVSDCTDFKRFDCGKTSAGKKKLQKIPQTKTAEINSVEGENEKRTTDHSESDPDNICSTSLLSEADAYFSIMPMRPFFFLPSLFCPLATQRLQNHLPFGLLVRLTQEKWNHSTGHCKVGEITSTGWQYSFSKLPQLLLGTEFSFQDK
jgi:hypothetical protein